MNKKFFLAERVAKKIMNDETLDIERMLSHNSAGGRTKVKLKQLNSNQFFADHLSRLRAI